MAKNGDFWWPSVRTFHGHKCGLSRGHGHEAWTLTNDVPSGLRLLGVASIVLARATLPATSVGGLWQLR